MGSRKVQGHDLPAPEFLAPILMVFTTSGATLVLSMWEPTMAPALLPWPPFAEGGAWKTRLSACQDDSDISVQPGDSADVVI